MTFSFVMWSAAPFAGSRSRFGFDAEGALDDSGHEVALRASLADRLDEGARR